MPFVVACVTNDNKYGQLVDENSSWSLYLSTDEPAKEEFGLPVVSLWARDKETGDVHKVMTSNPDARITYQYESTSHIVPVDCIRSVFMARIISPPEDPLKLLIEGCPDSRNVALLKGYAKKGKAPAKFIEVMTCPNGCITGPVTCNPDEIKSQAIFNQALASCPISYKEMDTTPKM